MDNVNFEKYQQEIKEMYKELVPDEVYDRWADTFDIESDGKKLTVVYHGTERIKKFRKQCKITLFSCIISVMGEGKKIKIIKRKRRDSFSPKVKKNIKAVHFFTAGMAFVCAATAIVVVMFNYIGNRDFRETFYSTSSIKVDSSVRVVQISDLHGVSFGKDNKKLTDRVRALEPDVIIMTGDIVDSAENDLKYAIKLSRELSKIAPSYYVYGNNEVEDLYDVPLTEEDLDKKYGFDKENRDPAMLAAEKDKFEKWVEAAGVKVLKNEKDTIDVRTMKVDVYGVLNSNPSSFWSYSEDSFLSYTDENPDNLKITAVHEPFIFEEFNHSYWGDLMIAGHTHGGVVRVPVLGPLYTNEGGLFPEHGGSFVYGRYNLGDKHLIVSSGLENRNVLRINNQPELVIIDINKF